jgi:hypothetical protein
MQFNINDKVRVKLTKHGKAMLVADHVMLFQEYRTKPAYTPKKEDAEGWSEWQLWALMDAFGHHMHNGGPLCFETNIDIVINNTIA